MAQKSGPSGGPGRPEEGGRDPWAPPEQPVRLSKQPEQPGQAPPGANPPVGPPPTAPDGPHPSAGFGAQSGYGHAGYGPSGYGQSGYGQAGYPGYGTSSYGAYAGYSRPDTAWAGAPLPQGTAVASMVLGIIGLVLTFTCWGSFVGILVAPVALVLGVVARRKADRGEAGGRGYATSGFVMGIVGTVLAACMVVFLIYVLTHMEEFENDPYGPYDSGYQDARARTPAVAVAGR